MQNNTPFGSPLAVPAPPQLGDKISHMASQVKDTVSGFGATAANKFDDNREAAATGLKDAASSLHQNAGSMSGGDKLTSMAHSTATALDTTADWMRENSSTKIMADVSSLVKRNPGPSMLAAIAVGFLIGRTFSRNNSNG
jgi:ElaB/YqjD/DUF883 family membrane-anchored ribosome-binding protein